MKTKTTYGVSQVDIRKGINFFVSLDRKSLNGTGHQSYNLSDLRTSVVTIIWGHSTTKHYYSGPPLQGYAGHQ